MKLKLQQLTLWFYLVSNLNISQWDIDSPPLKQAANDPIK